MADNYRIRISSDPERQEYYWEALRKNEHALFSKLDKLYSEEVVPPQNVSEAAAKLSNIVKKKMNDCNVEIENFNLIVVQLCNKYLTLYTALFYK